MQVLPTSPVFDPRPIAPRADPPARTIVTDTDGTEYATQQLLIVFASDATPDERKSTLRSLGATVSKRFARQPDLLLVQFDDFSVPEAIALLSQEASVSRIEKNLVYRPSRVIPSDPLFEDQYALDNVGQFGGQADADIDAPEAWQLSTGTRDFVIGIIDSGMDYTHPDLLANLWRNPGEIEGNGIDDDGNGYIDDIHGIDAVRNIGDPQDAESHGTHIAGVIGAEANNGEGITGILWNSQIAACRFIEADGFGLLADAVTCLDYFADLRRAGVNVRITNNSWGGPASPTLLQAISRHEDLDIIFVTAAGNDAVDIDTQPDYPAAYANSNVISVASTTVFDLLSLSSNTGALSVDLGAPGSSILSTAPGGSYRQENGTSFAAPHVAGAAGFVLSFDPEASGRTVREILFAAVDPLPDLAGRTVTGGRLRLPGFEVDRDADGLPDLYELREGFDTDDPSDGPADDDGDGLSNREEFAAGTSPRSPDTDGDGLDDRRELVDLLTDPLSPDSDGDGLDDRREVEELLTDPLDVDSDDDSLSDAREVEELLTNPNAFDTDGDGLPDGYEVSISLDPLRDDSAEDPDDDGLSNLGEFQADTDPFDPDTDDDELDDNTEVTVAGTDPNQPDTDNDGTPDGWEVRFALNPLDLRDASTDLDGDLVSAFGEFQGDTAPNDPRDIPAGQTWTSMSGDARQGADRPIVARVDQMSVRWVASSTAANIEGSILIDGALVTGAGGLSAFSLVDGTVLWQNPAGSGRGVGTVGELIVRDGSSEVTTWDLTTGEQVASWPIRPQGSPNGEAVLEGSRFYYMDGFPGFGERLQATDVLTGELLWSAPIAATGDLAANGKHVLSITREGNLTALDPETGVIQYTMDIPSCERTGDVQVLIDRRGEAAYGIQRGSCVSKFDLSSGDVLWQQQIQGRLTFTAAITSHGLAISGGAGILMLDPTDGSQVWEWDSGGQLIDSFVAAENALFLDVREFVVTVDVQTGAELNRGFDDLFMTGGLLLGTDGTLFETSRGVAIDLWGDTDGDGLPDYWERANGFDRLDRADGDTDEDGDGLTRGQEFALGTAPEDPDTDNDDLDDGLEVNEFGTSPLEPDSDFDYIDDGVELNVLGTDPTDADTDGDGFQDGDERDVFATDPLDASSTPEQQLAYEESFEAGFPPAWRTPFDAGRAWEVGPGGTDGTFELVAPQAPDLQNTVAEFVLFTTIGELAFDAAGDRSGELRVYVNGVQRARINDSTTTRVRLPLAPGQHRIRLEFNGFLPDGEAMARVDALEFTALGNIAQHIGSLLYAGSELLELTVGDQLVRQPLLFPNSAFSSEVAFSNDHRVIFGNEEGLWLFDPLTSFSVLIELTGGPKVIASGTRLYRNLNEPGLAYYDLASDEFGSLSLQDSYRDLAVDGTGNVFALASSGTLITVLSPTGQPLRTLEFAPNVPMARQLAVSELSEVFIASDDEIIALSQVGEVIARLTFDADDLDYRPGEGLIALNGTLVTFIDPTTFSVRSSALPSCCGQLAVVPASGPDSDGDGIADWWESLNGLNSANADDAGSDDDGDGVTALGEFLAGADPLVADTDGDGLDDGQELMLASSSARADTDRDELDDALEANELGTSPTLADTDGDGLDDGVEALATRTDPLARDSDGDGFDDGFELTNAFAPLDATDLTTDRDGDGYSIAQELALGTDWRRYDSDDDGLSDRDEIEEYGTHPLIADSDDDDLPDGWEVMTGTSPTVAATPGELADDGDGDGFSLLEEYASGSDPRDATDRPYTPTFSSDGSNSDGRRHLPVSVAQPSQFAVAWSRFVADEAGGAGNLNQRLTTGPGSLIVAVSGSSVSLDPRDGATRWVLPRTPLHTFRGRELVELDTLTATLRQPLTGTGLAARGYERGSLSPAGVSLAGATAFVPTTDIFGGLALISVEDLRARERGLLIDALHPVSVRSDGAGTLIGEPARYFDDSLYTFHPTGRELRRFPLEDVDSNTAPQPVLSAERSVLYITRSDELVRMDTRTGEQVWRTGGVESSPAPSAGATAAYVTAASGGILAVALSNGDILWNASVPGTLRSIVSTLDFVFVSNNSQTIVLDARTGEEVWVLDQGGTLALGNDARLYALWDGVVTAVDLAPRGENDTVPQAWAARYPTESVQPAMDFDGDGLTTEQEFAAGSAPNHIDTDGDGLSDDEEYLSLHTRPDRIDSDGDGVGDLDELLLALTDPLLSDTDGDTLDDWLEWSVLGTDPRQTDSDGDRLTDDREIWFNTDPLDSASLPTFIAWPVESFEDGRLPPGWRANDNDAIEFITDSPLGHQTLSLAVSVATAPKIRYLEVRGLFQEGVLRWNEDHFVIPSVTFDGQPAAIVRNRAVAVSNGYHVLRFEWSIGDALPSTFDRFVNVPGADYDEDLIPDEWENSFQLAALENDGHDFDGDGLDTLEEYFLGTDPFGANGAPLLAAVSPTDADQPMPAEEPPPDPPPPPEEPPPEEEEEPPPEEMDDQDAAPPDSSSPPPTGGGGAPSNGGGSAGGGGGLGSELLVLVLLLMVTSRTNSPERRHWT
ncbi:MAG: S8 family serine peptidase [Pseudomonadota bacterium]